MDSSVGPTIFVILFRAVTFVAAVADWQGSPSVS